MTAAFPSGKLYPRICAGSTNSGLKNREAAAPAFKALRYHLDEWGEEITDRYTDAKDHNIKHALFRANSLVLNADRDFYQAQDALNFMLTDTCAAPSDYLAGVQILFRAPGAFLAEIFCITNFNIRCPTLRTEAAGKHYNQVVIFKILICN